MKITVIAATLCSILAGLPCLQAQTVLSGIGEGESSQERSASSAIERTAGAGTGGVGSPLPMFRFGFAAVRPHVAEEYIYSDGLRAQPGVSRSTHISRFRVGAMVELGENWTFDYSHAWVDYSDASFNDSTDQSLSLDGRIQQTQWTVALSSRYSANSDILVETARQTNRKVSDTEIAGSLALGGPFTLALTGSQMLHFLDGLPDWHEWDLTPSLRYAYLPTVQLSCGVTTGYAMIYKGADIFHVQPHAVIAWAVSPKINWSLLGGIDERKLLGGRRTWRETPIVSTSVSYQATPTTTLTLQANRQVSPSYFQRQSVDTKSWGAVFSQRLFQHLQLQLGASIHHSDYLGTGSSSVAQRNDRYRRFDASLSTRVFKYGTISGFYSHSTNDSGASAFEFESDQVGIRVQVRF